MTGENKTPTFFNSKKESKIKKIIESLGIKPVDSPATEKALLESSNVSVVEPGNRLMIMALSPEAKMCLWSYWGGDSSTPVPPKISNAGVGSSQYNPTLFLKGVAILEFCDSFSKKGGLISDYTRDGAERPMKVTTFGIDYPIKMENDHFVIFLAPWISW